MNKRPTPETDAFWDDVCESWSNWSVNEGHEKLLKHARRLENERDELKSDLEFRRGLFQLQEQQLNEVRVERDALQEQLDAAIMLGKMQERRHERELAEARGESFQVQAWKQLTEQHRNEMRGL
jgi:hypothetical protein